MNTRARTFFLPALLSSLLITSCLIALLLPLSALAQPQKPELAVGSKKFTESVILAEMTAQLLRSAGYPTEHRAELGGSRFLWNALKAGEIDVYPEYTGTIIQELLAGQQFDPDSLRSVLREHGLRATKPLGFNNTYALGMKEERAAKLGIRTISDLRDHPDLRFGFTNEFMDRGDGWPTLQQAYRLPQQRVRGMDHDLAYQGLESGSIDVIDLYSTDAEIAYYDLRVLKDDRDHFSTYKTLLLYRADLAERAPEAVALFKKLEGQITAETMTRLNKRVKIDRVPSAEVAASFLNDTFSFDEAIQADTESRAERLWARTQEHLRLVIISLLAAILAALPLGIAAARYPALGQGILGLVGIIYTIPALALLVFMIPFFGIGGQPAIVALFLYSLLPIVRNTHAGLTDIPATLIESAEALGLSSATRLWQVELPLAARAILAGIKTSAIINVGTATLGALIGAGGYGQPILTGIRLDDMSLILEGAVPAALLAVLVQGLFEVVERLVVSKGLRLTAEV